MIGAETQQVRNLMPPPPPPSEPRMLYSRKEAAYKLCISPRALDYLIAKKDVAVRRVGRKILVSHAELVKFARQDHDSVATNNTEGQVNAEETRYTN